MFHFKSFYVCAHYDVCKVDCLTYFRPLFNFCNPENVRKCSVFRHLQRVQKWNIGLKQVNEGRTFFILVKPERGRGCFCGTFLLFYSYKIFVHSHTCEQNRFKVANSDTATIYYIYLLNLTFCRFKITCCIKSIKKRKCKIQCANLCQKIQYA